MKNCSNLDNHLLQLLDTKYKDFKFKMVNSKIYQIDGKYEKGVRQLILKSSDYKKWSGKYLITLDKTYLCIDDSTNDCWCEEFRNYNKAIGWLNEEFNVS
ncbi:hypothetical protein [Staphylococcus cohnii]|uniref:hypothetical protein n=1 Tax=Staphylococcus cohnii TaxID=29382 RepID=UPI0005893DD0|nr:hypothetical protein [Staphylococcus cohnii]